MVFATCDKYLAPERSRVSILTDALEGQALDFYLDNIAGQVTSLHVAFQMLQSRFDSAHSRVQAQSYLESLSLESIRTSEQLSTAQELDFAVKRISSVAPCVAPNTHTNRTGQDYSQKCYAMRNGPNSVARIE